MTASKDRCHSLIMLPRAASDAPAPKSDRLAFFRAWAADPLRVASIIPSGGALSDLITSEISAATGPVIELGPGTGVFTRALLDRGVAEKDLTLIEYGSDFAVMLQARFPEARVLWMDAKRLGTLAPDESRPTGAIVSGLPLLTMPPRTVLAILKGAFRLMGADGAFYQFTYGPRCPIPRRILDRLGLKASSIGWTAQNLPPATVYRISQRRTLA